jgi:LCP family protein required for cell wall assembly
MGLLVGALAYVGLTWPSRFNLLMLGIDRTPQGTALGRSDTMVLVTFLPGKPYVGMVSIPRDLWVDIPGYGENRINAAHFFAENESPGAGPALAAQTVRQNFGVDVDGSIRIQFDGLRAFVDALGGIPVTLEQPVGKLSPGEHLLDGETALAFVRSREGSDDFFRMLRGQQFLRAVLSRIRQPVVWARLPLAFVALARSIDSSLPPWQWPRLAFALLRVGAGGIDGRIIDRTMANGFTTAGGAQVLAPDWTRINQVLMEIFGQ